MAMRSRDRLYFGTAARKIPSNIESISDLASAVDDTLELSLEAVGKVATLTPRAGWPETTHQLAYVREQFKSHTYKTYRFIAFVFSLVYGVFIKFIIFIN